MNAILEQINSLGNAFLGFAVPMLIQSGVLIVVLLALDFILRKRIRAVFRYWIWMIVLLKLVLPTTLSSPTSPAYWVADELRSVMREEPLAMSSPTEMPLATPMLAGLESPPISSAQIPVATSSMTWQGYVFLAWLAAVSVMIALLIQRAFFVRRLIAESSEASKELVRILERAREQIGIRRPIALRLSSTAVSPSVCGLLRPTILIPQALLDEIDHRHMKSILMHELAHIRRADLWVNSIQAIVQIFYIYNPLLWVANAIIRKIREQAVDEMVLVAMGDDAEDYPKTLLSISRLAFGSPALSLRLIGVVESKKALIGRIKHITSRPFPTSAKLGIGGLFVIFILSAALLPMARAEKAAEGNASVVAEDKEETTKSLHQAAEHGDLACVERLISQGANVNAKDASGQTALHYAAREGHKEIVEFLLAKGADVNVGIRPYDRTAAQIAMWANHTELVELLIAKGADVTPLHLAVYMKDLAKARTLLEGGADVNKQTQYGTTPLHIAAVQGGIDIVKLLIDHSANVLEKDNWNWTALHSAAEKGHEDVAALLIAKGADVNARDGDHKTPIWYATRNAHTKIVDLLRKHEAVRSLHDAAEAGDVEQVTSLVLQGADVNAKDGRGQAALHYAAREGHKEIVEALLAHGAEVNIGAGRFNISAAEYALWSNQNEVLVQLIDKGADVTPLHLAVHMRDMAKVKSLLEGGADVNKQTQFGNTPLHLAVEYDLIGIAELLIAHKADVNMRDNWNSTALHSAAQQGYKEIAELLIAKGAEINAENRGSMTALRYATREGHSEIVDLLRKHGAQETLHGAIVSGDIDEVRGLLSEGADVNSRNSESQTPLHVASQAGHDDMVKLLLANGADIEAIGGSQGRTALHFAALRARKNVAETLLAAGANVNSRNDRWDSTPLHDATIPGDLGVIALLVDKGADIKTVDIGGKTPLHNAVEFNRPEVVRFLLARGADINQQHRERMDRAPLHIAVGSGNKDMIELLLANGADLNVKKYGETALHCAIMADNKDMVRYLLAKGLKTSAINAAAFFGELDKLKTLVAEGADINSKDECGHYPLHCAMRGNQRKVVEFLIAEGANVNAKDLRSITPLHDASAMGQKDIAEILIAKGADVNARSRGDGTALYRAAYHGHKEIVELLIARGAEVDSRQYDGHTPLQIACREGQKDVAEFLISQGADVTARNDAGRTPLSMAKWYNHTDIIELLRKHGAKE